MIEIGGNTQAIIQVSSLISNEIGEQEQTWTNVQSVKGWLDYLSGESNHLNYNAKIQESSHIFVADYVMLDPSITEDSSRMIIDGSMYDIVLIDNPMGMGSGSQLEFYLKFKGGQL